MVIATTTCCYQYYHALVTSLADAYNFTHIFKIGNHEEIISCLTYWDIFLSLLFYMCMLLLFFFFQIQEVFDLNSDFSKIIYTASQKFLYTETFLVNF